ncbi:hemerythrin domain-containing protein [Janibacter corallicola]|uniref:hemerythrin domain-containing protein n=1 Tax=Janibacter corallicola TaxID=415212 RepID=UPI00082C47DE|nr:hemerythrin domain-containing protein [Janibacter corallicola]
MDQFTIPRPGGGDIVDLITDDHRLLEDLMRALRDETADRAAARASFAEVLVAHSIAEEESVYPRLRRKDVIEEDEADEGEEEHAATNECLLRLLRADVSATEDFESAVELVAQILNHHINEEEISILNPAQTETPRDVREQLGAAWTARRNQLLDEGCASREQVQQLVDAAYEDGLLPNDDQPEG